MNISSIIQHERERRKLCREIIKESKTDLFGVKIIKLLMRLRKGVFEGKCMCSMCYIERKEGFWLDLGVGWIFSMGVPICHYCFVSLEKRLELISNIELSSAHTSYGFY